MAFEVTATRRRPQQFESLAGQEFVVSTLKNAIEQGRIAHAYLFCGPRGVGKTTSARLLAKALNCQHGPTSEPCGECENCKGIARGNSLDVIEIDGASNTGVNDVRVIKEEVLFPPTSSKYKIYIIDEVHMLSQSAFNALLKTIEEPPEYVVFIFATTEAQKVPATIRSRCQQFNFQLIPLETIKKLLSEACREMNIEAEDEALFWIAKEATGSMRDAYTLFDQVVSFSNGKITLEKIREKLGLVGVERLNEVMLDVLSKNQSNAVEKIQTLLAKGVSIDQLIKDFTDYFRSLLLIKEGVRSENVLGIQISSFPADIIKAYTEEQLEAALEMFLKLYRDIRYSLNPRFELELAISKLVRLKYVASNSVIIEQISRLKNDLINGTITPLNPEMKDIPSTPAEKPVEKNIVESQIKQPEPESEPPIEIYQNEEEPEIPVDIPEDIPAPVIEKKTLDDVLPQGVGKVERTEDGLVLQFGSRFFYQAAMKEYDAIISRIKSVEGSVNVVLAFSEVLEQERKAQLKKQEPQPAPTPVVQAKPLEVSNQSDEAKHFAEDLLYAFRGHEEK